jgi:HSP20 family protein
MDVSDTPTELRVRVELPGIPRDEIEVGIVGGGLVIRGERRPEPAAAQEHPLRLERSFGPFQRSLNLPPNVHPSGARALCRDGILEVRLPKRPGETGRIVRVEGT